MSPAEYFILHSSDPRWVAPIAAEVRYQRAAVPLPAEYAGAKVPVLPSEEGLFFRTVYGVSLASARE